MDFIYNGQSNAGGVYKITNRVNGRVYIGSTSQFKVRWATHLRRLMRGDHVNPFLQNDFNKCGSDAFQIEIISVIGDKKTRYQVEGELIRQHWGDGCYNLKADVVEQPLMSPLVRAKIGAASAARPREPHTTATKEKIRQSKIGKKQSPEVTSKILAALRALYADQETRKAIYGKRSDSLRGVPRSESDKAKMRAAWADRRQKGLTKMTDEQKEVLRQANLGKKRGPRSDETKAKLRLAWVNRPRTGPRGPMSEATKAKIKAARTGWNPSPETREKMSIAHKGRTLSEAAKAKMSVARKGKGIGRRHSDATRICMSEAKKGRVGKPLSDATKAKISAANKNHPHHPHSEATRAKMSAAQKARRAKESQDPNRPRRHLSDDTKAKMSAAHKARRAKETQVLKAEDRQ